MSKARQLADLGNAYSDGGISGSNLIINGSMQCFQRATAATTMTNTYGAVDRFRGFSNGGGAFTGEKYDMTTSEIAATGQYQALKMLVSTADTSIAASEYYSLAYRFEGDDLQQLKYGSSSAQSFTVSFWVKSDTTGTYFLTVDKIANGQAPYRIPIEYTISSADTWEQKIITVSPTAGNTSLITSSAGAIGGGTGHGLSLYWGFAWGTDYHGTNNTWSTSYGTNATANNWMGTVGNDFYLTGVQLEIGDTATPFEHRSYADQLQACQRYFQKIESLGSVGSYNAFPYTGLSRASTIGKISLGWTTPLRAAPTVTTTAANTFAIVNGSGGAIACSSVSVGRTNVNSAVIEFTVASGLTVGQATYLTTNNATDPAISVDAEL